MSVKVNAMDAFSLGVATGAKTGSTDANANVAVLSGVKNVGEGLTNSEYSVVVTKNAATYTGTNGQGEITATSGTTPPTATLSGAYTGKEDTASNTSIQVKVSNVDNDDKINGVMVSFDGGTTWSAEKAVTGTDELDLGQGIKISFADQATATDVVYKFGATASNATIQLAEDDGTTLIGNAVTVRNDATQAKIGDSDAYKDVTVQFNFATLETSATDSTKFSVSTDSSRGATFKNDGSIDLDAKAAAGINVKTQDKANAAIEVINAAIETVSGERSKLGAVQNRLEHTINNLNTSSENLTAAESRVRDVDYALAA